jgi:hypothetical protein
MSRVNVYRAVLIVLIAMNFTLCRKNPVTTTDDVVITSISPNIVKGGDTIKIIGKNLLKDISNTVVLLNGKTAEIVLSTADSIKAKVPLKAGSGPVIVKINNKEYVGPSFDYDYKVIVTTIAGSGNTGSIDGGGLQSSFYCPWGITADTAGDLFIADCYNRLIRKISSTDYSVSSYFIPTLVNGKNFYSPYNIAIDNTTQNLYVTDFNQHLMKVTSSGNMDVIYIDSMPLTGIAVDPSAHNLYISNNTTGTIVKTDMNGQNKELFSHGLVTPRNIFFNHNGDMFVTAYPGPIYKIDKSGSLLAATKDISFGGWEAVADTSGNFFLADHFSNNLKMIDKNGNAKVIAGSGVAADVDGIGLQSSFDGPQGIAINSKGELFVTTYNYDKRTGNRVRKIVLE